MSAAKQCSFCGGKRRGRAISHDSSCPARHAARRDARTPSPNLPPGPLTAPGPIETGYAFRDDVKAAEWLAFIGLGGRSCYVDRRGWLQWDGKAWRPSSAEHVRKGIRKSFEGLHANLTREWRAEGKLTEDRKAKLYQLLDINKGFDLMPHVKRIVTVAEVQR